MQAGSSKTDSGDEISFTGTSEEIRFYAEPQMGIIGARFKLTETERRKL
ncbi:hypothetical protein TREAZ_0463 [Leadbettera azotonutricia ZAS-9]|uniref:Uncharacterized protein n=1 Tax=Leadbettera azotonutricia (strain ATCC BAA-888 / DSM 13862 / ZAS-9) TaxID=545695 RepID=F5YCA6_LEAAZ|nr:hypothetical protein TREAZ_0463 [Leadbettera azotonutricia ZAS-9]